MLVAALGYIHVGSEVVGEVHATAGTVGVEAHACFCYIATIRPCHMVYLLSRHGSM